jgi:hypothetical protein
LVSIRVEQIDLDACNIFVERGKGAKDLILTANPENRFLFESRRRTKYTTRRVEQIVATYAAAAAKDDGRLPDSFYWRARISTGSVNPGIPCAVSHVSMFGSAVDAILFTSRHSDSQST